ncbi:hypothetical protein ACHAXH_009918 [Discostella pseudostelligera]
MDKFFSNLVGGGGGGKKNSSKNEDKKQPSKDAPKNSWQGGSGDLDSMKKKNAPVASKIDSSKNILANAGAGINDALGKIDLFNKSKQPVNNRGGGQSLGGGNRDDGTPGKSTLDAQARKQAVIAAAEAREAKHKATQKPIPKMEKRIDDKELKNQQMYDHDVIASEETRRAVAAVKQAEMEDAKKFGYNPYEAKAMTSGQARTATVAMVKGEINAENAPSKIVGSGETPSPGRIIKPKDPTDKKSEPSPEFEHAFSILVTSNSDHAAVLKSLSTMRTLIKNATTKGQQGKEETSSKYRRVRLSNAKIKETITDMQGALELMMSVGFVLSENDEDGETYLVYPPGEKEACWLSSALEMIESYENGGS